MRFVATWLLSLVLFLPFVCTSDSCGAGDLDLPSLIAEIEPSVVRIELTLSTGGGIGSGFVTEAGIVTNYHVIEGATSARVVFSDKSSSEVKGVLAYSPDSDLALLAVPSLSDRTALKLASGTPRKGEAVVAFGAPQGFSFTASDGIVSGLRTGREVKATLDEYSHGEDVLWVQTTAAISGGNSGGPLVNANGEVIGVNSWYHAGGQNLNFAVSFKDIHKLIERAAGQTVVAFKDIRDQQLDDLDRATSAYHAIYAAFVKGSFDEALSEAKRQLEAERSELAGLYLSTRVRPSDISTKESYYRQAKQALEDLKSYRKELFQFLRDEGSLVGLPGRWYVFQVAGPGKMLVKPSRMSDEVFLLSGVSAVGIADGITRTFDGVWFALGDTYSYTTVAGGSNTIYRFRAFGPSRSELESYFAKTVAVPAVEKILAGIEDPVPPAGEDLQRLNQQREVWMAKQDRLASEKRIAESERDAKPKVDRAAKMLDEHSELAKKWLREVVDEHPDAPSANRARVLLGMKPVTSFRTWTSGKYKVEARLVRVDGASVVLERMSGKQVSVPLSRLSEADQNYAKTFN